METSYIRCILLDFHSYEVCATEFVSQFFPVKWPHKHLLVCDQWSRWCSTTLPPSASWTCRTWSTTRRWGTTGAGSWTSSDRLSRTWTHLTGTDSRHFQPIWRYIQHFEPIRMNCCHFQPIGRYLPPFKPIRMNRSHFIPIGRYLQHFWTNRDEPLPFF